MFIIFFPNSANQLKIVEEYHSDSFSWGKFSVTFCEILSSLPFKDYEIK